MAAPSLYSSKIDRKPAVLLRQQPLHGKAIGFKQQYGNFLDPILILELKFSEMINLRNLHYTCVVELVGHDTKSPRSTVIVDRHPASGRCSVVKYQVNLRGTKTNCGRVFRDPYTGLESLFFVFNDLAVRTMGNYRIQAIILDMDESDYMGRVYTTIYTKPFEVQSARNYDAKIGPTKLMKSIAIQGNIAIGRNHKRSKQREVDAEVWAEVDNEIKRDSFGEDNGHHAEDSTDSTESESS